MKLLAQSVPSNCFENKSSFESLIVTFIEIYIHIKSIN